MADNSEVIETPEVEEIEVAETEPQEAEGIETDVGEGAPDDLGLVVEIGGDEEDDSAPDWVNQLRRENRELKKWKREQESKGIVAPQAKTLPPRPEAEDFDYDHEAHAEAVEKWTLQKLEFEREQSEQKALQERAAQRWEQKLTTYEAGKEKLGAPDFDDAEAVVAEIFSKPFPGIMADDVRMGIIKQGAKDATALVYALGRNPERAKALAEIDDPVEFAFALGELSGKMRIVRSGAKPAPEKRVTSAAPGVAGAVDNTLERLREEAAKTGDYTKVVAYKRQMKK